MSKIITYLGNNQVYLEAFANYAKKRGYTLVRYSGKEALLAVPDPIFLLIEPYYEPTWNEYFSSVKVWHRFFWQEKIPVRLVLLGDLRSRHRAYLNILDLPSDLSGFLEDQPSMDQFSPTLFREASTGAGIALSPWEEGLPLIKTDLHKILIQFFDGHDKLGFRIQLNRVKATFNSAASRLIRKQKQLATVPAEAQVQERNRFQEQMFEEMIQPFGLQEWHSLYERWNRYYPLFQQTPFLPVIQMLKPQIEDIKEKLDAYIKERQYFEIEPVESALKAIHQQLKPVEKTLRLSF